MQKEPEPLWRGQGLALAYHAAGKKKEADAALAEYIEKFQNDAAFQIAEIYAYRGETDKAFEWLERAYKQRDGGLVRNERRSAAAQSGTRPALARLPEKNETAAGLAQRILHLFSTAAQNRFQTLPGKLGQYPKSQSW